MEFDRAGQGLGVVAQAARQHEVLVGREHPVPERPARSGGGDHPPADAEGAAWQRHLRPVHAVLPTEYDIDHLGLPKPLRGNVAFTYYPAGHMLYSSEPSLAKFAADLKRFYAADASGLAAIDERPAEPAPDIRL